MKEIQITEIENMKIGNAQNEQAGTGCTVLLFEKGAPAGLDVRGGGPASRESELLKPMAAAGAIHGILLSGGSAFGLDAAGGVMRYLEERGIGSYAVQLGELKVGAIVAVNALGDVFDWRTGEKLAGMLDSEKTGFLDSEEELFKSFEAVENRFVENTTIGAVITNGRFDKARLGKIAGMAHDGYARAIRPVHTTADGDSIYAVSTGTVEADLDMVGALAARVMAEAIRRAVLSAKAAYGYPAAGDLK